MIELRQELPHPCGQRQDGHILFGAAGEEKCMPIDPSGEMVTPFCFGFSYAFVENLIVKKTITKNITTGKQKKM
jgi:hypothetical protein